MARSQPIVYTLSLSQSLLYAPLPHTSLLLHLLYSNSLSQFFTFFSSFSALISPDTFSAILASQQLSQQLSSTDTARSVQRGHPYDNLHVVYTNDMRSEFPHARQSHPRPWCHNKSLATAKEMHYFASSWKVLSCLSLESRLMPDVPGLLLNTAILRKINLLKRG